MTKVKSLKDISWDVSEPTYRADPAYSYSQLSHFLKGGFEGLEHLNDKLSSPSLTFGSMVDTLLTDGKEAFDERFYVATMPELSDTIVAIVDSLFREFHETHNSLAVIPAEEIVGFASQFNYQPRWKPETRVKDIIEKGSVYYDILYLSEGKEVVTSEMYEDALTCIDALRTSEDTKWYFQPDNQFEDIERLYQLKFKGDYEGIPLRCMMDLAIVDHKNKIIYPCDLKTTYEPEWRFYRNFIKWHYYIQAQLYWRLLRDNMDKDPYFKDFKLAEYRFIVVSRGTVKPKVWEWKHTTDEVDISIGDVKIPNWRGIVKDLHYYLTSNPDTPIGITSGLNDLEEWIKREM